MGSVFTGPRHLAGEHIPPHACTHTCTHTDAVPKPWAEIPGILASSQQLPCGRTAGIPAQHQLTWPWPGTRPSLLAVSLCPPTANALGARFLRGVPQHGPCLQLLGEDTLGGTLPSIRPVVWAP